MFLKNKNIIFKIRRSKVTDYATLTGVMNVVSCTSVTQNLVAQLVEFFAC